MHRFLVSSSLHLPTTLLIPYMHIPLVHNTSTHQIIVHSVIPKKHKCITQPPPLLPCTVSDKLTNNHEQLSCCWIWPFYIKANHVCENWYKLNSQGYILYWKEWSAVNWPYFQTWIFWIFLIFCTFCTILFVECFNVLSINYPQLPMTFYFFNTTCKQ